MEIQHRKIIADLINNWHKLSDILLFEYRIVLNSDIFNEILRVYETYTKSDSIWNWSDVIHTWLRNRSDK